MEEQPEPTTTSAAVDTATPPADATATTNGVPATPTNDLTQTEKGDLLKLALNHLVQGKRHLLVKDIASSITSLGESCQLLTEVNGPLSADNAEAHFYYGKALLEQSRLDLAVFDGGAAPEKEGESDEESGDEAEEDEEKEEESPESVEMKESDDQGEKSAKTETDGSSSSSTTEAEGKDSKAEEEDLSTPSPEQDSLPSAQAGTSTLVQDNEQPSTSNGTNGEAHNGADKEGEEELSNLELAWEVLELAKIGYNAQLKLALSQLEKSGGDEELEKAKTKTKLHLQKRLSETHSLLGEVATESENYQQAVEEFKIAMQILTEIEGEDSREVAQYHFQMGLAYSFAKEFQLAIESFEKSKTVIELRMLNLQTKIDNKQTVKDLGGELDDPSYSEETEILELKSLLPELDEKVADTIDAERENKAALAEAIQDQEIALKNSPVKNPNPPAVNDISHLVKKKKKAEEPLDVPPPKRACTDSNNTTTISTTEEVTSTNGHEENGQKNGPSSEAQQPSSLA